MLVCSLLPKLTSLGSRGVIKPSQLISKMCLYRFVLVILELEQMLGLIIISQ